jgi:hypothetical protein
MGGRSSKKKGKKGSAVVPYDPDEPPSAEELENPQLFAKRIKQSRYASLQEGSSLPLIDITPGARCVRCARDRWGMR